MKRLFVLLSVFALLSTISGCKKTSNKGSVTITVMRYTDFLNSTGALVPANGATVRYYVNGGSVVVDTKTAGTDGKVTFSNLDPGTYNFNAYQTINAVSRNGDADVVVAAGDSKVSSITLD